MVPLKSKKKKFVCSLVQELWTHVLGQVAPPAATIVMALGRAHGPGGLLGHCLSGLQYPEPPWPSH
jgi:hypothetical protein